MLKFNLNDDKKFRSFINLMETNTTIIGKGILSHVILTLDRTQYVLNQKLDKVTERNIITRFIQDGVLLSLKQIEMAKKWACKFKDYLHKNGVKNDEVVFSSAYKK